MPIDLEFEINSLKEQIGKLQVVVNGMQTDTEKKEEAIANLAREKEKLTCDLYKERRANKKLKHQLEEEREFYYREKEEYCKEMNECKKLKRSLTELRREQMENPELTQSKAEIANLKETLNRTLQTNYNLSVKFLRMKNTKHALKERFRNLRNAHEQVSVFSVLK